VSRALRRAAAVALAAALGTSGCATLGPPYEPRLVARGELTLTHDPGFRMYAGDRPLAEGVRWTGLEPYVRCVPEAARLARQASSDGATATLFTALGVGFGIASLGGLAGFAVADGKYVDAFLATGVGVAVLGTALAGLSNLFKNRANGQAVDAMNLYNDAVGSLGATCDDLTYPAPVGPAPRLIPPEPALPPPPPP
jgi:hypothetical protein